jgi:AraC-like DNA-binding protein
VAKEARRAAYSRAVLSVARPEEPAVSRSLFLGTVAALRMLDVDIKGPLAKLGLEIADLADLPERLRPAVMNDLWEAVNDVTGQRGLGLRMAERVSVDLFSTFGRVLATSATLGDALARGVRLFRLLSERQRFALRLDGRQAVIILETAHDGVLHREGAEFLLGSVVTLGRQLAGRHGPPIEVRFVHDRSVQSGDVEAFFGCPIRFGSSENSLTLSSEFLLLPVRGHDPAGCAALQREAESLLSQLSEPNAFRRDVVSAISREIDEGNSSIVRVAARLGLHPKALSRSLRADGITYRELLEEVRLRLAHRYLEQRAMGMAEIAFRLGYSEKSAFNRAFKRWTGKPPDSYRTA